MNNNFKRNNNNSNSNSNFNSNYKRKVNYNPHRFQNKNQHHNNRHQKPNNETVDDGTKKLLINYIYNTIILSNYKYKLIEFDHDLPMLKERTYYVSPNYNGIHSLLIFIKINDKYISAIIDRKTLTYNISQINYDKVKIIPVSIRLDEEVYNGTIIDGVLLYNNVDNMKNFVVNDIYYLRGKEISSDKITNKILNFTTYIETVKQDSNLENLILIVNKLYSLKDIQQLVNVYIPKSKYGKSIKGISFYPEYSGTKLIYLYNNCAQENSQEVVKKIPQQEQQNKIEIRKTNIVTSNESLIAVFKMKKTDIVDVYNLYLGEKFQENGKLLFKYKKVGIAYIPTKECSYFCKDAFSKMECDSLLFKCKYDQEKSRWIPFDLASDRKRSDLITDVPH
ncbi:hypothetical protein Indivirus_3_8 [Indivirus ILV1]|uniref:mRNA capping enzyme n=1 Tax=Indivirus ILV1 TaxID=1977633 RepID=A0A1V0SDH1_9VIRU|nr:hypothetical protein Indivirus_3_8 [Indivirus ILV1]